MRKTLVLCFIPLFLLISCASTNKSAQNSKSQHLNKVYITNSTPVSLLPPSSITQTVDSYQYFEGKFGARSFASMLYLFADSEKIQILMLNEMGIQIGSITYDGVFATMESTLFPKNLKCEYILLDLQNAYASEKSLKNHYESYKLLFESETLPNGESVRRIKKGSELIEEVHLGKTQIEIKNYLRKYTYILTLAE